MSLVARVARPPEKPLLIFDGDCAFCRRWIVRWRQATGEEVDYLPLQSERVSEQFSEIARSDLESAAHLIEPNGEVFRGAEAVLRALDRGSHWPWRIYRQVPGAALVCEFAYRVVASNRTVFSWFTRLLWGPHVQRPTHYLVRWLFLRGLGIIYLIAFASLATQIIGLAGSDGIAPAKSFIDAARLSLGGSTFRYYLTVPTLCWFRADDAFLTAQCTAGIVAATLLILGIAPLPSLVALWVLYLSLTIAGTVFLSFQWDTLLLETGLLAIFFAPLRLWPDLAREAPPSRIALWLLRWLLFRLMFASGCVKLLSGDKAWHDLTALTFHYETQCLPSPLAWFVHQWPIWTHKASCLGMFAVELVVPFLIFLPRRPRLLAFWLFAGLQGTILLTGNYTFFNWLSLVLGITLLDDFMLMRWFPSRWRERVGGAVHSGTWWVRWPALKWLRRATILPFAAVILAITGALTLGMFQRDRLWPKPIARLYQVLAPFRSANSYGLFAVMTTIRPEIVVEGSRDGVTWLAYEFKYKPGDLQRRPPFVAPHQPRLDWQMWFAALGDARDDRNRWFVNFCLRLLQAKRPVLDLLEQNPFPDAPPRFIRARLYDYHFTTPAERRQTGAWWKREFLREYLTPISLRRGEGE